MKARQRVEHEYWIGKRMDDEWDPTWSGPYKTRREVCEAYRTTFDDGEGTFQIFSQTTERMPDLTRAAAQR